MATELVGLAEIAALFGITKQVASNWRTRKKNFPAAIADLKSGPVWQRDDIIKWAKQESIPLAEDGKSARPSKKAPTHDAVIVALMNMKGGVGKSTLTANLGWFGVFERTCRVLLVDLDPQFNLSQYILGTEGYEELLKEKSPTVEVVFRNEGRPNSIVSLIRNVQEYHDGSCIHLIPASLELGWTIKTASDKAQLLKKYLDEVRNRYDLILIDCPPTESLLSFAAYYAADYVFIPVKPEFLPTIGLPLLKKSMEEFASVYPEASVPEVGGIIFNDTTNKPEQTRSKRAVQELAKAYKWKVFRNELSHSESYPAGARTARPIFLTDNARWTKKDELSRVGTEFLQEIGL
ncbi:ParA family protein [Bradyrhizobium sp.]|uniref:ParA family protein n=1 Tax=Bradyrhizobium sp. TaxID=376 RepID=UPI0039E3E260